MHMHVYIDMYMHMYVCMYSQLALAEVVVRKVIIPTHLSLNPTL